jgi:S1-C subfamily serine protease
MLRFMLLSVVVFSLLTGRIYSQEAVQDAIKKTVFKITATLRSPDFLQPWNRLNPKEISGTGFVIEGERLLTNAHVVRHTSEIYVQAEGSSDRTPATIEFIDHELDLALLKLDDASILSNIQPLPMNADLPTTRSEVVVLGYPVGGDQLSVTKGIVSRVEYTGYAPNTSGLRTQIDAAINSGNSGGPAICNNEVIGVAFSNLRNADNIGYIIPASEVQLFLSDCRDGKFDGKYSYNDYTQTLENPAIKEKMRIPNGVSGLMVSQPRNNNPDYPLQTGDIITKIGEHSLDSRGNVHLPTGQTLNFRYYIPLLEKDGLVPITRLRGEQLEDIQLPVTRGPDLMVPFLRGDYPRYAIFGPMTFEAVTAEMLMIATTNPQLGSMLSIRRSPLSSDLQLLRNQPGQEYVVVPCPPFTHRLMKGYTPPVMCTLKSVNNIPVHSLRQLVEWMRDSSDEYIEFCFYDLGTERIVFRRKEFIDATESILTDNNIRKQFSPDLEEVWHNRGDK